MFNGDDMKTLTLSMLLLLFAAGPFANAQMNTSSGYLPNLQVTGRAKKMVMPDKAVFSIRMSATEKEESAAVKRLNDITNTVLGKLKKEGFTENQIMLTGYSININYDYSQGGTPRKTNYTAVQSVVVKFDLDKDRVLRLFNTLSGDQPGGVEIHFFTEASDALQKSTSAELIQAAVQDARSKADLMAKAAGLTVKGVLEISYDVEPSFPQPMRMEKSVMRMEAENDRDYFSINEMEFHEAVRLTYRIE